MAPAYDRVYGTGKNGRSTHSCTQAHIVPSLSGGPAHGFPPGLPTFLPTKLPTTDGIPREYGYRRGSLLHTKRHVAGTQVKGSEGIQPTLNPLTQVRILAGQPGEFCDYLGASGICSEPFLWPQMWLLPTYCRHSLYSASSSVCSRAMTQTVVGDSEQSIHTLKAKTTL